MENQNSIGNIQTPNRKIKLVELKERTQTKESNFLDFIFKFFLKNRSFKKYNTIEIAIHKKGRERSYIWSINRINDKLDFLQAPASVFNTIFNQVKKSKTKKFFKTQEETLPFSVNGSFLGKEFEMNSSRMVTIVSNGIFLPYEESEINDFSENTQRIAKSILLEFEKEEIQKKQTLEKLAIDFLKTIELFPSREIRDTKENHKQIISEFCLYNKIELFSEVLNSLKHEISNPLFGISLATEEINDLIREKPLDDLHDSISCIQQNSIRCLQIIKNFQNLYDSFTINKKVNILDLIKETVKLTKSETRSIQIIFDLNKEFENDPYILTNPIIIGQIIFNLIINSAQAIKHCPEITTRNFIKIEINKDQETDPPQLTINITDNGPGIAKENNEQIFSPFFTTKEKGTGLGLNICKMLAQKINAKISFWPNFSFSGVTFSLVLDYTLNENTNH